MWKVFVSGAGGRQIVVEVFRRYITDIQYFISRQWILVEQGAEGVVQFGQLSFKGVGALEKGFDTDGPEFLVIGGGIRVKEGVFAGLHSFEDGAGYGGEFGKVIVEGVITAVLDREIDVSERVGHFVEPDVLAVGIIREFADKMDPREIDAVLADMSFEGGIIGTKAIFVL